MLLTVDIQNRRIVSFNGTPSNVPALFQSNTLTLKVQCVNPGQSSIPQTQSQQYSVQNMGGFGMRAAVGPSPQGIAGPTVLALGALTWDPVNQLFFGDLALNTTGVDGYLDTASAKSAYFELNLTLLGTRITIVQTTFTLTAVVDELLALVPTPVDSFRTAVESDARYMPRVGAPGDVLTLTSPNGLLKLELGIDNNGNFTTNIIQ